MQKKLKPAAQRKAGDHRVDAIKAANPAQNARLLLRARQQQALQLLSQGRTPDQISLELGIGIREVQQDVAKATERLVQLYAASPQHTFVRYAVFQLSLIRKLQQAVERFEADEKTVQYNSIVAALRAQSDAYDRILDKGISFGVIERRKATGAIRKAPADIRNLLKGEILTLSRLLDEVDLSIEFKTARARLHHRKQEDALQAESTYTVIVRKPLVGPHGVIRAVPDWKYKRKLYTRRPDGKYTDAPLRATPEQRHLHSLQQEIARLTTLLPQKEKNMQANPQPPQTPVQHSTALVPRQQAGAQPWLVPPTATSTQEP